MAIALALGGCSASGRDAEHAAEPPERGAVGVGGQVGSERNDPTIPCQEQGVRCVTLSPSRIAVVYLSDRSIQGQRSAGVVLWHPGGPGLTPPSRMIRERGLPTAFAPYDIAYLVEPWVATKPSVRCRAHGATDPTACPLESLAWSDDQVRQVVDRIRRDLAAPVVGVYGVSFGATALAPLLESTLKRGGWVILENPAPPPGTPLDVLLRGRAAAIEQMMVGWGRCQPSATCATERRSELREWTREGVGTLDPADMSLGLAALTTNAQSNAAFISRLVMRLDAGQGPARDEQRALRRAARRFELRGSSRQVLPELVGLWAETCRAFGAADQPTGIAAGLSRVYAGCAGSTAAEPPSPSRRSRVLILTGDQDAVVPPRLQARWRVVFPRARYVSLSRAGHFRDNEAADDVISAWLA